MITVNRIKTVPKHKSIECMFDRLTLILCVLTFFFFYYYSFQRNQKKNVESGIRTIRMKESVSYTSKKSNNNTVATSYLKDFGIYPRNRITPF